MIKIGSARVSDGEQIDVVSLNSTTLTEKSGPGSDKPVTLEKWIV